MKTTLSEILKVLEKVSQKILQINKTKTSYRDKNPADFMWQW